MLLSEIKMLDRLCYLSNVEVGTGKYDPISIVVTYQVEPASSTQHELDDPSTTEFFPQEIHLVKISTTTKVNVYGEDGEIVEVLPIGYDVYKMDISNRDFEYIADLVEKQLGDDDA